MAKAIKAKYGMIQGSALPHELRTGYHVMRRFRKNGDWKDKDRAYIVLEVHHFRRDDVTRDVERCDRYVPEPDRIEARVRLFDGSEAVRVWSDSDGLFTKLTILRPAGHDGD